MPPPPPPSTLFPYTTLFRSILLGAVANALQAITNLELVGTVFEEGATLFVVYGAAMAVFGGVLFWAPKLWGRVVPEDRKSTRLNSSHLGISYAVFCLKKKID